MEKITLKPNPRELLFKADEANTHFDVFTYTGSNPQEKMLGSIYLVGHAKYGEDEDLGYVINLISSLARREYYSDTALKGQDPKKAFEQTLKKLNEVLEDFFKNKELQLSIGLAAIAGDQLYISKLGKFKVGLARNGEYIDVLNNLTLFQKSEDDERQFSNVISGKLQSGDKVFAFYPFRSLTSRERSLQAVLMKEGQEQFTEKLALLASTNENFSCCGVHIALEQIKEIPLASLAVAQEPAQSSGRTADSELSGPTAQPVEKPKVIAAELSVGKKTNMFSKLKVSSFSSFKVRGFIIIAAIIVIPLIGVAIVRGTGESSEVKAAYAKALEQLNLAKTRLEENNSKEARALILDGLSQVNSLEGKKIDIVKNDLTTSLNEIDRLNATLPAKVGSITPEESNVLVFTKDKATVLYNGSESLIVNGKASALKDPLTANDATVYENNLYTLSGNHIYKYTNALKGETARTAWGSDDQSGTLLSITVDGNVYALSADSKVITYFKGEKKSSMDLPFQVTEHAKIYTAPNGSPWYILNNKRLHAINKETGAITTTYDLSMLGGIKNITVGDDGNVLILAEDFSVWSIATQP